MEGFVLIEIIVCPVFSDKSSSVMSFIISKTDCELSKDGNDIRTNNFILADVTVILTLLAETFNTEHNFSLNSSLFSKNVSRVPDKVIFVSTM